MSALTPLLGNKRTFGGDQRKAAAGDRNGTLDGAPWRSFSGGVCKALSYLTEFDGIPEDYGSIMTFSAVGGRDRRRLVQVICPSGKITGAVFRPACQAHCRKIFLFYGSENHPIYFPVHPTEGRIAIVTDAGLDAMDAGGAFDEGACWRTEKSCGSGAPTLASSSRKATFADDGGKQARSPGRARRKPLKPLRRKRRTVR